MLTKDQYHQLRNGFITLLTSITSNGDPVVIYGNRVPIGSNADKYILISGNSSLEVPNKSLTMTQTTMQISIFCKGDMDGNEHEDIGAQVLEKILPKPYSRFQIENFDVVQLKVVGDVPIVTSIDTTETVLERNILVEVTLNHLLRQ